MQHNQIATDMVERVANAIRKEHYTYTGTLYGDEVWEKCARAAIAAARDPTEAMVNAGDDQMTDIPETGDSAKHWRAMVDAALAPGNPESEA